MAKAKLEFDDRPLFGLFDDIGAAIVKAAERMGVKKATIRAAKEQIRKAKEERDRRARRAPRRG